MLTWISRHRRPPPTSTWRRVWPTPAGASGLTSGGSGSTAASAAALHTPARAIARGSAVAPSSVTLAAAKRAGKRVPTPSAAAPSARARKPRKPAATAATPARAKPASKRNGTGVAQSTPATAPRSQASTRPPRAPYVLDLDAALREWRALRGSCHVEPRASAPSSAPSTTRAAMGRVDASLTRAASSNTGEVSLEERTRLLSAVSLAPRTYPHLHRIFFVPLCDETAQSTGDDAGATEGGDDDGDEVGEVDDEDLIHVAPPAATVDTSTSIFWRRVRAENAAAVVASEATAAEVLSLLHVLHFPRDRSAALARVHRCVWGAVLEAIGARVQRTAASPAAGPRRATLAMVVRAAAEGYRPLLLLNPGDFPAWMGIKKNSRVWQRRVASVHAPMQQALRGAVAPAFAHIRELVGPVAPLQLPASADGCEYGDAATLLMAYVLSIIAAESGKKLSGEAWSVDPAAVREWADWRDATHAAVLGHLSAVEAAVGDCALEAGVVAFADALSCLVLLENFSFAIPTEELAVLEEKCRSIARRVCHTTDPGRSADLFTRLCVPAVTAELRRLSPERQTYVQVVTDICAAASAFLRTRPEQLGGLLDRLEAQHRAAMAVADGATSAPPLTPRPRPKGALAQLLYAMLCGGFPPEAVLTSSLCVSLSPRDAIDVVRIVSRFSRSVATAPFPVRTRTALVESVASRLQQCCRDSQRVVASAADAADESAGGPFDLKARLEQGSEEDTAMPSAAAMLADAGSSSAQAQAAAAARKRRGGKQGARGRRGQAAEGAHGAAAAAATPTMAASALLTPAVHRRQVNQTLYVTLEVIVEALRRGDAAAVQTLVTALMPLLMQEGGVAASADVLESVWASFRARLVEVGCDDVVRHQAERSAGLGARSAATGTAATPLELSAAVESALALLPTLFLLPLSEAAAKLVAGGQLHTGSAGAGASPQRQRGLAALSESVLSAPAVTVEQLTESALRLSTAVVLCGMPSDTVVQLTALHSVLSRSQGKSGAAMSLDVSAGTSSKKGGAADGGAAAPAVAAAFAVVERLERLLSQLSRQSHGLVRDPLSHYARHSAVAVQQLLAIYITSTAGVAQDMIRASRQRGAGAGASGASSPPAAAVEAQYRRYLLTVAHLLYRLRTEYPVEVEPPALRTYRVEVLDPALTAVMAVRPGAAAMLLPLTTLTEVTVVMCVPESVQHVSPELVRGVAAAVQQHLAARQSATAPAGAASSLIDVVDTATGVLSSQLLCAAATLCLRADDALTSMLMELLDLLSPLLSASQTVTVLKRLHATGAPLASPSLRRLVERLVNALREDGVGAGGGGVARVSVWRSMNAGQRIGTLHTLSAIQRTAEAAVDDADVAALLQLLRTVPYSSLVHVLVLPEYLAARRYTIGECGLLVELAAHLRGPGMASRSVSRSEGGGADAAVPPRVEGTSAPSAAPPTEAVEAAQPTGAEAEAESVRLLPRTLALYALQALQHPHNVHDIPLLLRGYAALPGEHQLQQQVLRAFIARTMRAAAALSPDEVVQCVEAYCAGGIVHVQLYGVLLGRVADLGRKFSLELAVRLLQCGVRANDASVRTVCVTAVQPVFSAQVRGLLQSDPHMLVTVASTALAIMHCLRDCFPQDDIGAAVLANVARYQRDASLPVIKAALELAERRGSADYDVVHLLARHCTERVMPTCTAADLASIFYLLIACGLRSAAVMEATYKRLAEVCATMSAHALTRLAKGLLRASVEVDIEAMETIFTRIAQLAAAPPTTATPTVAGRRGKTGRRAAAAGTAPVAAAVPAAAPLSAPQVCVLLQLMRSVSGRVMVGSMSTVDVLLAYAQRRLTAEGEVPDGGAQPPRAADAAAPETTAAADSINTAAPTYQPPAFLTNVTLHDVEGLLRSCIDLAHSPKAYQRLTRCLADYALYVATQDATTPATPASASASGDGRAPPERLLSDALLPPARGLDRPSASAAAAAAATWQTDLILLVDLCSLFIRLGEAAHPVVVQLLERQYERRNTLLQRALLVKTARQSLEAIGPNVHPALYKLLVDGELV